MEDRVADCSFVSVTDRDEVELAVTESVTSSVSLTEGEVVMDTLEVDEMEGVTETSSVVDALTLVDAVNDGDMVTDLLTVSSSEFDNETVLEPEIE